MRCTSTSKSSSSAEPLAGFRYQQLSRQKEFPEGWLCRYMQRIDSFVSVFPLLCIINRCIHVAPYRSFDLVPARQAHTHVKPLLMAASATASQIPLVR